MTQLKVTDLKKELKKLDQTEVIQLITDLYKLSDDVKQYLSSKFIGEEANAILFDKAKKAITDEFFPSRGSAKLRLNEAKKAITDFKKITGDNERTVDLMLYYVEIGTEFTNAYGDIDSRFYNSMISMYGKVVVECQKYETFFLTFKDRLYKVIIDSNRIGWGYHEALCEKYYELANFMGDEME